MQKILLTGNNFYWNIHNFYSNFMKLEERLTNSSWIDKILASAWLDRKYGFLLLDYFWSSNPFFTSVFIYILFIIGPCQYGSESNSFFPRDFFTENWLKNLSYWEMNEKLLWDVMWEFDTRIEKKKRGNEDTFHIKKTL